MCSDFHTNYAVCTCPTFSFKIILSLHTMKQIHILKKQKQKTKKPPTPQNQTPYFTKQSCNWRRTGHPMNCCACWSSTYGVENVYRIGHNVGLFFNRSNLKMENMHLPKCSKRTRAFIKQLSKHSFDKKSSFLTAKYLLMPHLEISIVCCISYF